MTMKLWVKMGLRRVQQANTSQPTFQPEGDPHAEENAITRNAAKAVFTVIGFVISGTTWRAQKPAAARMQSPSAFGSTLCRTCCPVHKGDRIV